MAVRTSTVASHSDLSKLAFMAIGPSRIAAYTFIGCAFGARISDAAARERLAMSHQRIQSALAMLEHELFEGLAAVNASLPKSLDVLRKDALSAIEALERHPVAVSETCADVAENEVIDLFEVAAPRVETNVTAFLFAFEDWAIERDAAIKAEHDELLVNAVRDIQSISRMIHLISINASIEASRVGEVGRGFGVIATEIQSLSGNAREALERITVSIERNVA